jgi:hypothetical protein
LPALAEPPAAPLPLTCSEPDAPTVDADAPTCFAPPAAPRPAARPVVFAFAVLDAA